MAGRRRTERPVRMPGGLSRRTAMLLVALAFGATFAFEALPDSGSPTERTAGKGTAADRLASRDLGFRATTVPALREARKAPARVAHRVRTIATPPPVTPVRTVEPGPPDPTVTAQPTSPPAPRYVPPAPPPPTPAPTAAPPSGEFDTTGEASPDTGGEP